MSAVPSHRDIIERRQRMGVVPSAPVVRLDLIRPVIVEPEPASVEAETREEFIDLPNFLPVGRHEAKKVFRQAKSRVVLNVVSKLSGVTVHDIKSHRRTGDVIIPRQVACWAMHKLTPLSLPRIGSAMGGRDHTTILHAVRKIDGLRATDEKIRTFSDEVFSEARYIIRSQEDGAEEAE